MPKGDNPNSRKNLIKNQNLSSSEVRERGRKGGLASAEARRVSVTLTECLKEQCTPEVMKDLTNMLVKRAKQGNLKAYELLRDQIGEKPTEKVAISTVNEESINRLQEAIKKRQAKNE